MEIFDVVFGMFCIVFLALALIPIVALLGNLFSKEGRRSASYTGFQPSVTRTEHTIKEMNETINRNRYDSLVNPDHYGTNK